MIGFSAQGVDASAVVTCPVLKRPRNKKKKRVVGLGLHTIARGKLLLGCALGIPSKEPTTGSELLTRYSWDSDKDEITQEYHHPHP